MEAIEPAEWRDMDESERLSALRRGGCLTGQGRLFAKDGERMTWGAGFQFGSSPVPYFAMSGAIKELGEALELGACPFARDLEDDGPMEASFNLVRSPHAVDKELGSAILTMCWTAGAPLLDPSSESYIGAHEAEQIQYDIAYACYSRGCIEAAAGLGVEVDPKWLVRFAPSHPMMASQAVMWGNPRDLQSLIDSGLPLGPIKVLEEEPPESLWCWIEDDNKDIGGIAMVLWSAGLDPRVPGEGGLSALDMMRANSYAVAATAHVERLIASIEEKAQMEDEVPRAPRKARSGL